MPDPFARVSVVIPVYNGAAYLAQAIDSVLSQRHADLEVIVIDDGSEDDSAEIAFRFGASVRCIGQPHGGAGAARNAGVAVSTGAFLAFLDADDLWTPGKLAAQMDLLLSNASLDCVFGLVENFRDGEAADRLEVRAEAAAPGMAAGAMLVRRPAFLRVGPFRTDLAVGEFIEWYARARTLGLHYEILPGLVLRRRIHGANTTFRHAADRRDLLKALRGALPARRSV